MPTATTLPLLVLIAALWWCTRGQVLSIVVFTSMFGAASALNLGNLGVSPWMFAFALCMSLKLMLGGHRPLRIAVGVNRIALRLFLLFVLWAICSAALFPWVFQGVFVDHGTTSGPLTWHASNLAQTAYLLAAGAVYLLTVGCSGEERASAVEWYLRACVAVSLFAAYQLASATLHVPYPSVVLATSPTYTVYPAYRINGAWRLDATFCEASQMAEFLLPGIALLGWELATRRIRPWRAVAFLAMVGALLFSLSTTGYVTLLVMAVVGAVLYAVHLLRSRSLGRGRLATALLVVSALTFALTPGSSVMQTASKTLSSTLLDKSKSESYRDRTATHESALRTLQDTAYLGAGWGSVRASGLGFVLLGTVGIPGLLLFLAFYTSSFLPFAFPRTPPYSELFASSMFAASVMIFSMFLAGSEPVSPVLWMLLGVSAAARPLLLKNDAVRRSIPFVSSKAHPSESRGPFDKPAFSELMQ